MRTKFAAVLLSLSLFAPAQAQFNKATLNANTSSSFPDNTAGAITPATTRTYLGNLINSFQQYAAIRAVALTTDTITVPDYGQLVTYNNASPIAVTLPQAAGSFQTFNFYVSNLGAGLVTITPTVGTINGAANFTVSTGLSVWVISDGTNWQVWKGFGSGSVVAGTAGQLAYYPVSSNSVSGNPNANISAGALTLGQAGSVVGSVAFGNATSGTETIQPAAGALGSGIATLPAGTYNIVGDSLTQTLTTKTINCANNTCTVRIANDVSGLGTGVATALGNNANASGGIATVGNVVTSLTPGAGLVSSITASCSQTAIGTTGTLSVAECVNAQSGASYAIQDSDRGKLITATNAGAQAYTIAQAGAASAFQAGWYVDIQNNSTNAAGVITITATTSTINDNGTAATTAKIQPGQHKRLVSDGTNYQVFASPSGAQLPGSATNDAACAGCVGETISQNILVGSQVGLTTGTPANIATITLTAGDWDIDAQCYFAGTATTALSAARCSISTTSGTENQVSPLAASIGYAAGTVAFTTTTATSLSIAPTRQSLSGSQQFWLVDLCNFTASTCSAYGQLRARRAR